MGPASYIQQRHRDVALTPCDNIRRHRYSGDKIEKNEMDEAFSTYGEKRGVYRVWVGKPEGNRPLERPRHKWDDNIKMDLQEVGWGKN
jgi:hypothetical protein